MQAFADNMKKIWEEVGAALAKAKEDMKRYYDRGRTERPEYAPGDKVWLEGKNLKTIRPKAKLDAKRHGPFTVTEVLGDNPDTAVNFRLDIPKSWKRIHPVFHASLLTPYVETPEHGPNFLEPVPDLVDGEEEFEVELIPDGRPTKNKRGFEYLVKWEGYPDTKNEWWPTSTLKNASEAIAEYHKHHPLRPRRKNYQQS